MKRYLAVIILLIVSFTYSQDPCNDSRYLELKKVPLDSMSDRQYEYFMLKEKSCSEMNVKAVSNIVTDSFTFSAEIVYGRKNNYDDFLPSKQIFIDDKLVGAEKIKIKLPIGEHSLSVYPSANIAASKGQSGGYIIVKGKKNDILKSNINYNCEDHNCDEKDFRINIETSKVKKEIQSGKIVMALYPNTKIKAAPKDDGVILKRVNQGSEFYYKGEINGYYEINYNGVNGYIEKKWATIKEKE